MKQQPNHDDDALRHHTYDGIQEYDKRLPNWWLFTLYGAIVFSAAYWAYYHWSSHMVPGYVRVERQIEEIQKAALATGAAPTDIQLWKLSTDPAVVESGQKIFVANCVACHGPDGKGLRQFGAPNLTDAVWLYGGDADSIRQSVHDARFGVMPNWAPRLSEDDIRAVSYYVHGLGGGE